MAMLISEQIAAELEAALVDGVQLSNLVAMNQLTGLAIVKAKAAGNTTEQLAAAAAGVLRESCARVDGDANGPASTVLGLADGTRHLSLTRRRKLAAELVPIGEGQFRKSHEAQLLLAIGEDLVIADSAFQARKVRELETPDAVDSRLNINWLERHEAYRRIWSPVSALRGDLLILLGYIRANRDVGVALDATNDQSPAPWPDIVDRGMNLMWRRAQFTSAVDRFVEDFGGLWLLSDPTQESRAAEAIHQLDLNGPCGDADDSWLRLRLAESKDGELDDFMNVVYASDLEGETLRSFLRWADKCNCQLESDATPRPSCDVHSWLAACNEYIELIDEDWMKVADWYRGARPEARISN